MTLVVCLKQVPAVGEVQIDPQKNTLIREGVPSVINPSDLNALEVALRLKDTAGARVIALSMGPGQAREALQRCLEMGADEAYLLCDPVFAGSDTLATARVLAKAVTKVAKHFSLLLCGHESIDGNTAQVGPEIGEILGIPHANNVTKLDLLPESVQVERRDFQRNAAGFDLGHIQNVVDEIQQVLAARAHQFQVFAMLAGEIGFRAHEIRKAQYGV